MSDDAEEALRVIEQEQAAVQGHLSAAAGPPGWVIPSVLAVAAAAIVIDNGVVQVVVTVVYLVGVLLALGTPARAGVVPRDTRRSVVQAWAGAALLFAAFTVGLVGQQFDLWWLSPVAAALAFTIALLLTRRRRAAVRG